MPIRRRISDRPKVERNTLKLESAGGKFVVRPFQMIGSADTIVMYYDGEKVGTFRDEAEVKEAQERIRNGAQ